MPWYDQFSNDLNGKKIGRLLVLEKVPEKGKNSKWLCVCDCGNQCVVSRPNLVNKHTESCGCYCKQRTSETSFKHGLIKSCSYAHWGDMKTRCTNPKTKGYKNYGGRGISFCESWNSFKNFYEDMGDPIEGLSLERIDNDKGYSKENCCWIPKNLQAKNRRNNVYVEFQGEKITARELWKSQGEKYSYQTYLTYIKRGKICALLKT